MAGSELVPDFLTVEEAATVLRIGRTAAYGLTQQWRATGGAEGLPVVRFGRQLRVPRAALEAFAGGPISALLAAGEDEELHISETHRVGVTASRCSEAATATEQLALFDLSYVRSPAVGAAHQLTAHRVAGAPFALYDHALKCLSKSPPQGGPERTPTLRPRSHPAPSPPLSTALPPGPTQQRTQNITGRCAQVFVASALL